MPIYEYRCAKCGTFEVTQGIKEPGLKRCPTCKGKVERLLSATSFVLKGSGWYATDYARSGSQTKHDSTATDTKNNGASSDTSSTSDSTAKTAPDATKTSTAADSSAKSKPSTAAKSTDKSTDKSSG